MYTKFRTGTAPRCPCGNGTQTSEHILKECWTHSELRQQTWPQPTPLHEKLHSTQWNLLLTLELVRATGDCLFHMNSGDEEEEFCDILGKKIQIWVPTGYGWRSTRVFTFCGNWRLCYHSEVSVSIRSTHTCQTALKWNRNQCRFNWSDSS